MPDLFAGAIPLSDQRAEVEREIKLRQRVYPRWVADGRLTEAKSERQIAVMQAVLATLESAENWGLS
jgi:hypothetical protein